MQKKYVTSFQKKWLRCFFLFGKKRWELCPKRHYHLFQANPNQNTLFSPHVEWKFKFLLQKLNVAICVWKNKALKKIVAVVCQFPSIFGLSQGKKLDFAQRFFLQISNFNKTKQVTVNNPNRFWRKFGNFHQQGLISSFLPCFCRFKLLTRFDRIILGKNFEINDYELVFHCLSMYWI